MSKEDKIKINSLSTYTLEISNLLSSGKKIATLDVGGTSYNILAPATYAWSEITNRPTKLSQFTDDVVSGKYLPLTGGTISVSGYDGLTIASSVAGAAIKFKGTEATKGGYLVYSGGVDWRVSDDGWSTSFKLIHSGNVGDYALKTDGSNTMKNDLQLYTLGSGSANVPLTDGVFIYRGPSTGGVDVGLPDSYTNVLNIGGSAAYSNLQLAWFRSMDVLKLYARVGESKGYGAWKEILHQGNYSNLITGTLGVDITGNAASATALKNKVSLWGNEFDGTQSLNGNIHMPNGSALYFITTTQEYIAAVNMASDNVLTFGNGTNFSTRTLNTRVDGYNIYFRTGAKQTAMTINSSGNMTIGSSDLAGTTHRLYVSGTAYVANVAYLTNVEIRNVSDKNYIASVYMSTKGFHIQGRHEGVAYINTILNQSGGNVLIGTTEDNGSGAKLQVVGNVSATSFIGNLDGTYVNKLTGYTKATAISALATTDTLNTALGKLEYKADVAYNLVKGAYDGDGTIENLEEILRVLDGIKDTDTIQAIVGKYLPLSGGIMSGFIQLGSEGVIGFGTNMDAKYHNSAVLNLEEGAVWLATTGNIPNATSEASGIALDGNTIKMWAPLDTPPVLIDSDNGTSYNLIHSGNFNSYSPKLNGTGATGTWNIDISGTAANASKLNGINASGFIKQLSGTYEDLTSLLSNASSNRGDHLVSIRSKNWGSICNIKSMDWGCGLMYFQNTLTTTSGVLGKGLLFPQSGDKIYVLTYSGNTTTNTITADAIATETQLGNYVTLNTAQTISAKKTFSVGLAISGGATERVDLPYFLGIDAFDDGGSVRWLTASKVCAAIGALPTSGGTLTGSGNVLTLSNNSGGDIGLKFYRGGNTAWTIVDTGGNLKFNELTSNTTRLVLYENSQGGSAAFAGSISATSFIKSGSSDSYLLLGGGGQKAISDFLLKSEIANQELNNNLTTITKSLNVTADWMDTGIDGDDLPTGTYIVQVSCAANTGLFYDCYWSGVMSWWKGRTNDTESDEIILHRVSRQHSATIYLRTLSRSNTDTNGLKLQIAASQNIGAAYTYTFKFKRVI